MVDEVERWVNNRVKPNSKRIMNDTHLARVERSLLKRCNSWVNCHLQMVNGAECEEWPWPTGPSVSNSPAYWPIGVIATFYLRSEWRKSALIEAHVLLLCMSEKERNTSWWACSCFKAHHSLNVCGIRSPITFLVRYCTIETWSNIFIQQFSSLMVVVVRKPSSA